MLGINEHFFTRKRSYATTLVDLKNHKVFDVVLGRSEASLRSYLKRLLGKENVRVIVMDLSGTYRRIAQRYFPNALVVADHFHVMHLVNQHLLKLQQQYDPEGRKSRGLLSLIRRHHWKLSAVQKENLHQYLVRASASGTALRQAAVEWLLGYEKLEKKTSPEDDAPVLSVDRAV